eukprot:Rhum_TRINITY_DN11185_c0_g1::Rhum_TRINITY_DN11185_c0_g1_i1::g.43053::m.43053
MSYASPASSPYKGSPSLYEPAPLLSSTAAAARSPSSPSQQRRDSSPLRFRSRVADALRGTTAAATTPPSSSATPHRQWASEPGVASASSPLAQPAAPAMAAAASEAHMPSRSLLRGQLTAAGVEWLGALRERRRAAGAVGTALGAADDLEAIVSRRRGALWKVFGGLAVWAALCWALGAAAGAAGLSVAAAAVAALLAYPHYVLRRRVAALVDVVLPCVEAAEALRPSYADPLAHRMALHAAAHRLLAEGVVVADAGVAYYPPTAHAVAAEAVAASRCSVAGSPSRRSASPLHSPYTPSYGR